MSKKTFKGFTNQQTHQLLQESGYTGPAQKDDMDKFLASSPKAAAQIGRYAEIARMRVEGESLSKTGLAVGGFTQQKGTEEYTFDKEAKEPDSQRIGDVVTTMPLPKMPL